jgi:hypothetical protein
MKQKLVSTEEYTRILNETLAAHKKGAGLAPFRHTGTGYDWPKDMDTDSIYIDVSNQVKELYRTPGRNEKA